VAAPGAAAAPAAPVSAPAADGAPVAPPAPAAPAPGPAGTAPGPAAPSPAASGGGAPAAGAAGVLGASLAGPGGAFDPLPAAEEPPGGGPGAAAAPRRGGPRTVTRTVVRSVRDVVEVVPAFLWALIAALGALSVLAAAVSSYLAGRNRRLARQRERLLEDVGLLQSALLPAAPAQVPGAVASAAYRPAVARPAGGDFHDVFAIDDERLGLVIGRVSATGRRALGVTAFIRHVLRAYLEGGLQPRNALQVGADVLGHHLGPDYASVTLAVYDRTTSELTYASAGMPPPVVLGAAAFEPVAAGAPAPVGMGVRTGTRQTSVVLPPGSVACFFTDGLLDAGRDGERLGYRGAWRLLDELGPEADAGALVARVADGEPAGDGHETVSRREGEPAGDGRETGSCRGGGDAVGQVVAASRDDIAAVLLRVGEEAPAESPQGERRVEELELSAGELRGERPALFLRDCGIPSDRIDPLVEELRETGRRLGGAVLRVRVGPGMPEAETALRAMDVLQAPSAGA